MKRRPVIGLLMAMVLATMTLGSSAAFAAESKPNPEEMAQVSYAAVWEGDNFDDSEVVVTYDVRIDGVDVVLADGELSRPFHIDGGYQLLGQNVSGFPDAECTWEKTAMASSTSSTEDDVQHYDATVINTVVCDESDEPETPDSTNRLYWMGDGIDALDECPSVDDGFLEWTLALYGPGDITGAELYVDGLSQGFMTQQDENVFLLETPSVGLEADIWVEVDGEVENALLAISDGCELQAGPYLDSDPESEPDVSETDDSSEPEAEPEPEPQPEDEAEAKEGDKTERPRAEGDYVASGMSEASVLGLLLLVSGGATFVFAAVMLRRLRPLRRH